MRFLGRFFGKSEPEENSGVSLAATPTQRPPTMKELVQQYIRQEMSARAVDEGFGSFEDEDDFEEDESEIEHELTHHQVIAMSDLELREVAASYGIELGDGAPDNPGAQAPQEAGGGAPADPASSPSQPS